MKPKDVALKWNIEIVRRFKDVLKKTIKLDKIILFGSRAKGTFTRDSDFDLIIVSRDFEGTSWYKRPVKIYLLWKEDYPAEILCYTPEEMKQRKNMQGIVSEAVRTGVEV